MKHTWLGLLGAKLSTDRDEGEPPPLERAIVDTQLLAQAIQIELRYEAKARQEAPPGASSVNVLKGDGRVIVTAPHASESFRDGAYRVCDGGGTGALAEMLHKLAGATAIASNYRSPSDPSYYDDNPFKRTLRALIEEQHPLLVLDIHGSHESRPYDVDFGTMNGQSLMGAQTYLPALQNALWREGIRNFSLDYFSAARHQTIAKFASNLKVPAIQLEVSSTWLQPSKKELMAHRFSQLLQGLTRYVREVSGNPRGDT